MVTFAASPHRRHPPLVHSSVLAWVRLWDSTEAQGKRLQGLFRVYPWLEVNKTYFRVSISYNCICVEWEQVQQPQRPHYCGRWLQHGHEVLWLERLSAAPACPLPTGIGKIGQGLEEHVNDNVKSKRVFHDWYVLSLGLCSPWIAFKSQRQHTRSTTQRFFLHPSLQSNCVQGPGSRYGQFWRFKGCGEGL